MVSGAVSVAALARRGGRAVRYRTRVRARKIGEPIRAYLLTYRAADLVARVTGRRIIHCFGDSHAYVFGNVERHNHLRRTWLDVNVVGGATALGLENPNSRTEALRIFVGRIAKLPAGRTLLFFIGEVDCGFLLWYIAEQRGLPLEEVTERSFGSYTRFLGRLQAEGRHQIVVATVLLPFVEDYATWAGLKSARKAVRATLDERTALTKRYNAALRAWATSNGCTILDLEAEVTDPATGRTRAELINPNPLDHHYNYPVFEKVVARTLAQAGYA